MISRNALINSIQMVEYLLRNEHIYVECVEIENAFGNVYEMTIPISWGDWKHEHLRCDWIIKDIFPTSVKLPAFVDEEDGSDCYSATHRYVIVSEEELLRL